MSDPSLIFYSPYKTRVDTKNAYSSYIIRSEKPNVHGETVRAYVTSVRGTHPVISSITFALFGAFGSMSHVPLLPADSLAAAPM